MDARLVIADFIFDLENGLDTIFSRRDRDKTITLHSKIPHFAVIIYLAGNTNRIHIDGIRTFHLDQDQILQNRQKLVSRLLSLLGKGQVIYARQTVVARLEKRVTLSFLEENHLQMAIPGKYRYGLYHQGELVSIAVFSGGRRMREHGENHRSFELLRFCHKAGYRVVGALSKLLKSFTMDFHPNDIMTYVDRDWAQESNLCTLGFQERGQTAPQAFFIVGQQRHYIENMEHLAKLQQTYPSGYLSHNHGSTKLVLKL